MGVSTVSGSTYRLSSMRRRRKVDAVDITLKAVKIYPVTVLARAYVKVIKYRGGKYNSASYLDKILKEQMEKERNYQARCPP